MRWIASRAFPVHDAAGQVVRVAGISEDISERMTHQQHLEELANFDTLTHLPNRRLLVGRMLHKSVHLLAQKLVRETKSGATVSSRETEAVLLRSAETFVDALTHIRSLVKYNDAGQ